MGEKENTYGVLVRKPEGKNHLEKVGVDGSTILKRILKNMMGGRTGFMSLWVRKSAGLLYKR
jgi:hypothetical protein